MNRLADESSPYLLQHKDNPVDWYPYSPDAFNKAKTENKLIFLSIGYSACHWCHVLAHESFEDKETADIMNSNYVSIKVDREERPDIDQVYQTMVQLMGKQGGWPLSVFLTPDAKPIFIGTYFPNKPRYGMISFKQLLHRIREVYREQPGEVLESAKRLETVTGEIFSKAAVSSAPSEESPSPNLHFLLSALSTITGALDMGDGGFGKAPKFPNFPSLSLGLRQIAEGVEDRYSWKPKLRKGIFFTLDKMAAGGIYDHEGGGFARYSVDSRWLVPHFEKMLYDNAMALGVYSEAYQIRKEPKYKQLVKQTVEWLIREMYDGEHGFFAALDADSEGQEGKYYVWRKGELDSIIPPADQKLFYSSFGVTEQGNFEHGQNILNRPWEDSQLENRFGKKIKVINAINEKNLQRLFSVRNSRVYPHCDTKIITAWNALLVKGLLSAYRIFAGEAFGEKILEYATGTSKFLREQMWDSTTATLYRIFAAGERKIAGNLDDYAYLLQASIEEYNLFQSEGLFSFIHELLTVTDDKFWDSNKKIYYYGASDVSDIPIRPRLEYDQPLPNPEAVMVENLIQLNSYVPNDARSNTIEFLITSGASGVMRNPSAKSTYLIALQWYLYGSSDLGILLPSENLDSEQEPESDANVLAVKDQILTEFLPRLHLFTGNAPKQPDHPMFGKTAKSGEPTYYLCQGFMCSKPLTDTKEFLEVIRTYNRWIAEER